jgi:diguanylate cyclase
VSSQLRNTDILGRYGGEEFMVIMPHCDEACAAVVAEKIRHAIETDALEVASGRLRVTVSVGGCAATDGLTGASALVAEADQALYDAKHAGRNQVCIVHAHDA